MQIKKLETMTSRTGRQMQRYNEGCRQVVGCIPFRLRNVNESPPIGGSLIDEIEVLLISSQKNAQKLMFPKGGWELDEELAEAACRETFEEAGVVGTLMNELGIWNFKSNSQGIFHEGRMLPLFVEEVRDIWPEKDVRDRIWLRINEARERCAHTWMKEALDVWTTQLLSLHNNKRNATTTCLVDFVNSETINGITAQREENTWMEDDVDVWMSDEPMSLHRKGSNPTTCLGEFLSSETIMCITAQSGEEEVEYCLCS
ncbi:hypothetical protein Leryth_002998 [Lithospermum erythrorhizon]|nr:hypothetical protein Leryth_002998 [Lithospermum erythrorhizon]